MIPVNSFSTYAAWGLFFPFFGFIWGLFFKRHFLIALTGIFGSLILSGISLIYFLIHTHQPLTLWLAPFFTTPTLSIKYGVYLDSLSLIFLCVIWIIGIFVYIYSLGYMKNDPKRSQFFTLLSLFMGTMILLTVSPNFLQFFIGWEGVGVASYMLIGFWHEKTRVHIAAFKTFVTNRVGDIGMILGICFIGAYTHTLDFQEISPIFSSLNPFILETIGLCLFIGAMAKSAQFSLHVWLPDAMEGPTPVSALIHAATMVAAGIFLIIRCEVLYNLIPFTRLFMAWIGGITAVFGASVACTQNDIKKIIAYSTCSQLGLMILACGTSFYEGALFHFVTHAIFKALLFLGVGSVIHATSGEQDIRLLGGLYQKIPWTYGCTLIGVLSLIGIPLSLGAYSKERILDHLYTHSLVEWVLGIGVVLLTAIYSLRLIRRVFHGPCHVSERIQDYLHESPLSMLFPMTFLAIISTFLGIFLNKPLSHVPGWTHYVSWGAMALGGLFVAWVTSFSIPLHFYAWVRRGYGIDGLYNRFIVKPVISLSEYCAYILESYLLKGGPLTLISWGLYSNHWIRYIHNGYIYWYVGITTLCTLALVFFLILLF